MYGSGYTSSTSYTAYTPHAITPAKITRTPHHPAPRVSTPPTNSAAYRRELARDYLAQEKTKSDTRTRVIAENTTFRCERCGI